MFFVTFHILQMTKPRKRELTFLGLSRCQTLYVHYLIYSSHVPRLREVKWLPTSHQWGETKSWLFHQIPATPWMGQGSMVTRDNCLWPTKPTTSCSPGPSRVLSEDQQTIPVQAPVPPVTHGDWCHMNRSSPANSQTQEKVLYAHFLKVANFPQNICNLGVFEALKVRRVPSHNPILKALKSVRSRRGHWASMATMTNNILALTICQTFPNALDM